MMKLKVILLSLALIFIAPVLARAGAVCTTASEEAFIGDAVAKNNAKVYKATDKARDIILGAINAARISAGQEPFLVDTVMIGVFEYNAAVYVGTVMFKDHCVVRDTVKVFPNNEWAAAMAQFGLTTADFVQLRGA
tara:strand:+ start:176 stop:583 length:408 start_codon:yes stop_codon:yes gene_type:complete